MYVLVDGGFFVSRLARNWAPKGRFRRWMNKVERGQMNPGHFYQKARKSLYGELNYLSMRIKQAGYAKAEIHIMFDGTEGRQARGKLYSQYKANRVPQSVEEYDAAEYSIRDSDRNSVPSAWTPTTFVAVGTVITILPRRRTI